MRTLLALPLALLCACPSTQYSDAPPPEDTPPVEAFDAVEMLAQYLSGEFDSEQQSIDDPQYFAIQLITCAVTAPEFGDTVLYVEQASMDTPTQPYRQRLYSVHGDENNALKSRTEVYALNNPAGAIGLCDEDDGRTYAAGDVSLREGCGVHATWDEETQTFEGGTQGTDCSSSLGTAVYATSIVTIGADLLESWDQGWDADEAQAWGATAGPYRFVRRTATGDDDDATDDDTTDDDDATPPSELEGFYGDVAGAICGALDRCCNAEDQAAFFAPWSQNELLADVAAQLPPDAAACPDLVAEAVAITPFGDWVAAVGAERVGFDATAQAACIGALNSSSCGEGVRAALLDGACFGLNAPAGGEEQRSMFVRDSIDGDACAPIADGVGAAYFGSCDPTTTFCCYDDPACTNPYTGEGDALDGTCRPASQAGQPCSAMEPLQLCATGLSCNWDSGLCDAPADTPLSQGEVCVDSGWNLLGECTNGWCDLFGTGVCEAPRSLGATCTAPWECASGACEATCVENTWCSGS